MSWPLSGELPHRGRRGAAGADRARPLGICRGGQHPRAARALLASLYAELEREITEPATGTFIAQNALVSLILTEVARAMASRAEAAPSSGVVTEALRYIERHCTESISLRDVAMVMRRSPAYVTTLFTSGDCT